MDAAHDCWTDYDYAEVLSFVEGCLWQFVQANAAVHKPQRTISSFAQLTYHELRHLQRIYFLLSEPVRRCVMESAPRLLRRLAHTTDHAKAENRGLTRGSVDWNQTLKRRLVAGDSDPILFVTRLTVKTYDVAETQALKFLLTRINSLCAEVLGGLSQHLESSPSVSTGKWKGMIRSLFYASDALLKKSYLRDVSFPEKVTDLLLQRVRCARSAHFRSVYESLRLYRKLFIQEDREELRRCLAEGVLKPLSRDTLYEIFVLFTTMQALERAGWSQEGLSLIGYGKGIVAEYGYQSKALRIHYQTLPLALAKSSIYTNVLRKHGLDVKSRRPDLTLELDAEISSFKILEVKRTSDKQYIVDSFYKVLGYLKDFDAALIGSRLPHAVLIVWEGVEGSSENDEVLVVLKQRDFNKFLEREFVNIGWSLSPLDFSP